MESASLLENRIDLYFHFAVAHQMNGACIITGEELPFELFLYAEQGKFSLTLAEQPPLLCPEGETVLVPSDMAFRIETDDICRIGYIGVDYQFFEGIRLFSLFSLPPRLVGADKQNGTGPLCRLILQTVRENELTNSRLENAVAVNAALYRLALTVVEGSAPYFQKNRMAHMERLSPVFSHISVNLGSTLLVEELSWLTNLSVNAFYRLFKDTIGMSPKEYIITERLRQARLMLLGSALPIGKISRLCGYESPFSFSSLFHERYGCSPSLYRTQMTALLS